MKQITIHTDGGCHGNPGPGGWAALLTCGEHSRTVSGGTAATTNNRMELQAAIEALTSLKYPSQVDLYTDSTYVKNGITSWLAGWKRNGWRTKAKQPVKNADLWQALDEATKRHEVTWKWLKGHAGHAGNERCDELANAEIATIKRTHTRQQLQDALARFKTAPPGTNDLFSS